MLRLWGGDLWGEGGRVVTELKADHVGGLIFAHLGWVGIIAAHIPLHTYGPIHIDCQLAGRGMGSEHRLSVPNYTGRHIKSYT